MGRYSLRFTVGSVFISSQVLVQIANHFDRSIGLELMPLMSPCTKTSRGSRSPLPHCAVLVRAIEDQARQRGFSRLYLYTSDAVGFYERLGWELLDRTNWKGFDTALMVRDL